MFLVSAEPHKIRRLVATIVGGLACFKVGIEPIAIGHDHKRSHYLWVDSPSRRRYVTSHNAYLVMINPQDLTHARDLDTINFPNPETLICIQTCF